jgi:signal peptidase I
MIISRKKLLVLAITSIGIFSLAWTATLIIGMDNKIYVVFSDSMMPNLNPGDIVIVSKEDRHSRSFDNLKIGEIIVFVPPSQTTPDKDLAKTIVHRVAEIEPESNGAGSVRTKGDANPYSIQALDFPITKQNYIGKVSYVVPYLGPMLMYFDLIVRVFLHPLLYIIIGALIAVICLLELRKRHVFLRNLDE